MPPVIHDSLSLKRAASPARLAFACLLAAASVNAQQAATPETPRTPPAAPVAKPAAVVPPSPSAVTPPAQRAPSARPGSPRIPNTVTPAAPAQAPQPPAPPRQVVTVVHRLSGWKLLTWLAASGPPLMELDKLPSALDVHTNIVAGYVHSDGRGVVAHLPRGEAEVESAGAMKPPDGFFPQGVNFGQSEFSLLLGDGRRVKADFVGVDAATGLTLLEAKEPLILLHGDEGHTEDPTVGQRVRLYAPAPAASTPPAKGAPAAEANVIYLSITQADGLLTDVTRAPSGRPFSATARAGGVTPAWTGAVAVNEAGSLVGIVSQSGTGETEIVTGEMVRQAVERVKARRASAPQPWLGVRGDAAAEAPLDTWVGKGWKRENALTLIQNRQGVLLTSVPPGTPASAAGLRPGDVIARVGEREMRTAVDLSLTLKELPVDSTVDFTVWRSFESQPLKFPVFLKGTQNPALSTAEAEARAARESLSSVRAQLREVKSETRRLDVAPRPADRALQAELLARLQRAEKQLEELSWQMREAETRMAEARSFTLHDATPRPSAEGPHRPLQTFGLHAIGLTRRSASRLGARGGVLVVTVRSESPAAASGLRAGDVIETVNGRTFARETFRKLMQEAEGEPLSLGVVRLRQRINVALAADPGRQD